jgi:translation initiation factor SUI1
LKKILFKVLFISFYNIKLDFNSFNFTKEKEDKSNSDKKNIDPSYVDIYIQQRNARKRIITIEGLVNDKNILKKYAKDLRKILNCSCSVDKKKEEDIYFLKMSSKDLSVIKQYLIDKINIDKDLIRVHGNT